MLYFVNFGKFGLLTWHKFDFVCLAGEEKWFFFHCFFLYLLITSKNWPSKRNPAQLQGHFKPCRMFSRELSELSQQK